MLPYYIIIACLFLASLYCFWCAEQARQQTKFNRNMFQTLAIYEKVKARKSNRIKTFLAWAKVPRFNWWHLVLIAFASLICHDYLNPIIYNLFHIGGY